MAKVEIIAQVGLSELAEEVAYNLNNNEILRLFTMVDDLVEDCDFTRKVADRFAKIARTDCEFDDE